MSLCTTIAEEVKYWLGCGWDFDVFMAILIVNVVAGKAENGFRAVARGLALVVGVCCKFTAVMKAGEVTNKCRDKRLARHDAEVVVDQEKQH